MIPSFEEIKKRLKPEQTLHFIMKNENYFEVAEEFLQLQTIFIKHTLLDKVSLWIEMLLNPIIMILMSWYTKQSPSIFTMIGFHKTIKLWQSWFRFQELANVVREWTKIIRAIGGPFISTNDAKYHIYVYADGMQRIRNSLLSRRSLTKERTKRA
jgi:hypothetical protein